MDRICKMNRQINPYTLEAKCNRDRVSEMKLLWIKFNGVEFSNTAEF